MMIANPCAICPSGGKLCVPGRGPQGAAVMLVGEAPGKDEEKYGKCWIGKAGKELENYLTMVSRIDPNSVYLTNLVKMHPPHDRDPKLNEIAACSSILKQELSVINPRIIATLGRYSTQWFLGKDVSLERCHGMPVESNGRIVVPMYHPAAGLHNTSLMTQIMYDFEVLGRVVRGQQEVMATCDAHDRAEYRLAKEAAEVEDYLFSASKVAIDTESVKSATPDGRWWGETEPWCVSLSVMPGTALVVMARDMDMIRTVGSGLSDGYTTTIIHNAMYDLPILEQMGIRVGNMYDTMVMAYLTQSLPQGLKDLAYRLCGMEMNSYEEMVADAGSINAIKYLQEVADVNWPDNEPELIWAKGVPHVKKGWALQKRVAKMLRDYERDGTVDLRDRWHNIEPQLRRQAEDRFGWMPIGDLGEVELEKAVQYTGRDADATLRCWPKVMEVVRGMNIDNG